MLALFFFKLKTSYEMIMSDWISDVCSSDLPRNEVAAASPKAVRQPATGSFVVKKTLLRQVALSGTADFSSRRLAILRRATSSNPEFDAARIARRCRNRRGRATAFRGAPWGPRRTRQALRAFRRHRR